MNKRHFINAMITLEHSRTYQNIPELQCVLLFVDVQVEVTRSK